MKAKQYFELFKVNLNEQGYVDALVDCFRNMLVEIEELTKTRMSDTDQAMKAMYEEQFKKSVALVKLINNSNLLKDKIRSDAFKKFIKVYSKELYIELGWNK